MTAASSKIAFASGYECKDHQAIWAALDRVHTRHPGTVLLHGGSPKDAERIAACWADSRKVPRVAFRPDFIRHKNAAPFKRNDPLLETMPIGVVVFPGSGISDNLGDKARKLGIPLLDYRKGVHSPAAHHPGRAEAVGHHAEPLRPERLLDRHADLPALSQCCKQPLRLGRVVGPDADHRSGRPRIAARRRIRTHQRDAADIEPGVHDLVAELRRRLLRHRQVTVAHCHPGLGAEAALGG